MLLSSEWSTETREILMKNTCQLVQITLILVKKIAIYLNFIKASTKAQF